MNSSDNGDRHFPKLAEFGAHEKDKKHSHYLHDGNAIGFALDSMGGLSQAAMDYRNHLFPPRRTGEETKMGLRDHETMRP